MKTIYEHQFKLYQSHEGFFMASGHHLNDNPIKYELFPLPTPQFLPPGEKVKLEISSRWQVELYLDEQQNWQSLVQNNSSQRLLPPTSQSGIHYQEGTSQFFVDGQPIPPNHLTESEHRLLKYLYQNAGKVCSYWDLEEHVWGGMASPNSISQKVYQLRKKLRKITPSARKRYIETCRGHVRGYMLATI